LESWIGSADPLSIGPFRTDLPRPLNGTCRGDVGHPPGADVDRSGMICFPHDPTGAVKLFPASGAEGADLGIDL